MSAPPPRLELIEQTESSVLAACGNLVVRLHDQQVRASGMERIGQVLDDAARAHPDGICVLWVSLTRQPNPDERALRERTELIQRPGDALLRFAFVTERGGLPSTIKRSAAEGVRDRLGALRERMGIFQDLREGIAFIEDALRPAFEPSVLRTQVEGLWRIDRPGRPRLPVRP